MPPVLIGAGIAAAGSVAGGLISSSATKKAASAQERAAQAQIAASERNRDYQYNLNAPTIASGDRANELFSGFVGAGGDAAASSDALDTFRSSSGYQDLVDEGLSAVNSNAFARGLGRSGATLKALQDRGTSLADRSAQGWLGNLNTLMSAGGAARGLVAGIGSNTVNSTNAATQGAADAQSNAALANGANWSSVLQNLGQAASTAYGSSYGSGGGGYAAGISPSAMAALTAQSKGITASYGY